MLIPKYGLRKKFKKGVRLYIYPTMVCNLKCTYCTLNFFNGVYPKDKSRLGFTEWKNIIDKFEQVKEIVLSGGEPMLYKHYTELCNHILSKGYFLMIFSNLQSKKGLQVKPHKNLMIYASHHVELSDKQEKEWQENYKLYKKKYRVVADQLDKDKPILTKEQEFGNCYYSQIVRYSPDGKCFGNLHDMMEYLNEH